MNGSLDAHENDVNSTRRRLHRLIRIHDDLEILHERLVALGSSSHSSVEPDLQSVLDRVDTLKSLVKVSLEEIESSLAKLDLDTLAMNASSRR